MESKKNTEIRKSSRDVCTLEFSVLSRGAGAVPIFICNHEYGRRTDRWHCHKDFYELVVVTGGGACCEIDDSRVWLGAGAVQVFYPGSVHRYTSICNFHHYNILFLPEILQGSGWDFSVFPLSERLFFGKGNYSELCYLSENDMLNIVNMVEKLKNERFHRQPGWKEAQFFEFGCALIYLLRSVKSSPQPINSSISRIESCIRFMSENLRHSLSLTDMARNCNMSESSFRHQFLAVTGFSPVEYLIRMRLKRAITLFDSLNTLPDIARNSGFADANYFSRQFRKHFNCPPREFMRQAAAGKINVELAIDSLFISGTAE